MPLVDSYEQQVLDGILGDPDFVQEDLWVGLSSTTPTDAGTNVTEPSTGGYARVAIATAAGGAPSFGAASGTAPAEKSNSAILSFPTASGAWAGTLTHLVVFNASAAGTCRAWALLGASLTVASGETASVAVGALDLRLGKGTPG